MARKLEELPIYVKADAFERAVIALLDRPAFGRNRRMHDQISDAVQSVLANMQEGFEQPTDRALEKYLFNAKGSAAEVCQRLESAHRRRYITDEELRNCRALGNEMVGCSAAGSATSPDATGRTGAGIAQRRGATAIMKSPATADSDEGCGMGRIRDSGFGMGIRDGDSGSGMSD